MILTIKEYEGKEEDQLKQLLFLCFEDDILLNIVNSSKLKFAYAAFIKEKLVGFMFAWTSSIHPYCTYFRILSHPFYNWLDIEGKLLSKAEELIINNLPLQTSIWETSAKLKRLYTSNGFKEIRRTYMPSLKVADVVDYPPFKSEKYEIKTLTAILSNDTLLEKLTLLVKENYEKAHIENPIKEFEIEKWKGIILSDDLVPDGSYVYLDMDEKNIVAYSFLHESDKEDSLELGWCGAIDAESKELIPQLTLLQVNYALKHDIQFFIGEFDTTDDYAMEVLKSFPFTPCPTWITYQKE